MNISDVISRMTLEEKAAMCSGADFWTTTAVERLGIPSIRMSDGPHGLRKQEEGQDHLDLSESKKAVCFPAGVGVASSFNRNLLYRMGETLADECIAEDIQVILGPAINIKRSPLCGRNFEYMSEDPYLAGQLASSYVKGVQSKNVGVSVKHYAVNNQEKRRMTVSAVIDERTLREIYLSAFEEVIKETKPDTVMCSYNRVNGVYSSENNRLLNEILRDEWGFDGFTVSDWGAVSDRVEGIKAGLDLEMPSSGGINTQKLIAAVREGRLEEGLLDRAVANILGRVKKYTENRVEDRPDFDRIAHHKKARKIARESMVLLKNEGALPLTASSDIVFIGEFAEKPRIQGGGSSHINATRIVSALSAVRRHTTVEYAKGFHIDKEAADEKLIAEAVRKAARAEVAVIFAGLSDRNESEGYDRKHLRLPICQNRLIREVAKVQPNTVVVLHNGSPVTMPWINKVNAVLEAYLGGEACHEAVIDLLFGVSNPSGKLAETFPISLKDTPCYDYFPGNQLTVEYREGIFVGYRYYDKVNKEVLFPFGHGLSYTTFAYSDIEVIRMGRSAKVRFFVKNTGKVAGAEAAQVYVGKVGSRIFRAPRELKGFEKVYLKPGEKTRIEIELDERAFSYYCAASGKWCIEPGSYSISVGASSRDIRLYADINMDGDSADMWQYTPDELSGYYFGDPASISDEEFEKLLCGPIPEGYRGLREPINTGNTFEDAKNTKWGGRIYGLLKLVLGNVKQLGSPDMLFSSVTEMPIRDFTTMTCGKVSEKLGEALTDILNDKNVAPAVKTIIAELLGQLGKNN